MGESIQQRAGRALELPPEVSVGAVKLIISGRESVRAVNHRGIAVCRPGLMAFRCSGGAVAVRGTELVLEELNSEYLRIGGHIDSLSFCTAAEIAAIAAQQHSNNGNNGNSAQHAPPRNERRHNRSQHNDPRHGYPQQDTAKEDGRA